MASTVHYKFEDILARVGDQNKWQIMIFLFTWIEGCLIGFHHLSSSFLGASPDHWCNLDYVSVLDNVAWNETMKKEYAVPKAENGDFEHCFVFDLKVAPNADYATALKQRNASMARIKCTDLSAPDDKRYTYDKSEGLDTIVNDWNLVCDRLPLLSTIQGSYMGGVFVGCMVWGWASDRYGRRLTMLVAAAIQTVTSIVAAFATNYGLFIVLRFLIAFSVSGVFECGFVLVTEICGPTYRTYFGILTQFPFGIGASILPLVAYFIREWQTLQLAISIPCVLLASYYWFVPESPRWLMAEGRFEEAIKILKNGAKTNKRSNDMPSDEELLEMMRVIKADEENAEHQKEEQTGELTTKEKLYGVFKEIIILVETPEMRKRTLNVFYSWLIVAMVYYGLSFNTKNLGGDRYVSSFVSGFVEVPAVVVILPALSRLGRKWCYGGTFFLGGVACGLVAIITFASDKGDDNIVYLTVTIAMLGKFLISMTFAIAYLYTAELFPTKVRNLAVGLASTFARIGSISAPYIVDLLGSVHAGIPVVIFGICSTSAGLLSLMLPETLNRKLPESVAEVERAGKRRGKKDEPAASEMNAVSPSPLLASGDTEAAK